MSLKTPVQICTEKLTSMFKARGLNVEHLPAFIESHEEQLSVEAGEVLWKSMPIDRAVKQENVFGSIPRPKLQLTKREFEAHARHDKKLRAADIDIVPDPLDRPPADSKPAVGGSLYEKAVLRVTQEFLWRGIVAPEKSARLFVDANQENLNWSPSGQLRMGFRDLGAELTIRGHELLSDFELPKIEMSHSQYADLVRSGKQFDGTRIVLTDEKEK